MKRGGALVKGLGSQFNLENTGSNALAALSYLGLFGSHHFALIYSTVLSS